MTKPANAVNLIPNGDFRSAVIGSLPVGWPRESWFVLRAAAPGVSARALARAYGLEELRDYKRCSRLEIDSMRRAAPR